MPAQHLLDQRADLIGHLLRPAAGAKDERVATLDRDQGLEDEGRHRMGDREKPDDDADRAGNFGDQALGVVTKRALRGLTGQLLPDPQAGEAVLERLVADVADVGLIDGGDRQLLSVVSDSLGQRVQ